MSRITKAMRQKEFETIQYNLGEIGITAEVVNTDEFAEQCMLAVILPTSDEDLEADELPENPHIAFGYLNHLDEGDSVFTKYLMFYTKIQQNIDGVNKLQMLELVNKMNRTNSYGHFFYSKEANDESEMIQYKVMIYADSEQLFSEAVVGEALIEMGFAYEQMEEAILALKNN